MTTRWFTFGQTTETEQLLRANDPNAHSISVDLPADDRLPFFHAAHCAGNLLPLSTHIRNLSVTLDLYGKYNPSIHESLDIANFEALSQWITDSATLQGFALLGSYRGTSGIEGRLVPLFMTAVTNRRLVSVPPLQYVKIYNTAVEAQQMALLMEFGQLEKLKLYNCDFLAGEYWNDTIAANQVADAFRKNSTLIKAELCATTANSVYFCAILKALQTHSKLRELTLSVLARGRIPEGRISEESAAAIRTFFEEGTCPLKLVHFYGFKWMKDSSLDLGLGIRSSCMEIQEVGFEKCLFDEFSTHSLRHIFVPSGSLRKLWLGDSLIFASRKCLDQLGLVVGTAVGLREIYRMISGGNSDIKSLTEGLRRSTCTVEALIVENLGSSFGLLLEAIPMMRSLKLLVFSLEHLNYYSKESLTQLKSDIFSAFRSNASLWTVKINASFLDRCDCALLESFQMRNANLPIVMRSLLANSDGTTPCGDSTILPRLLRAFTSSILTRSGSILNALMKCGDRIGPLQTPKRMRDNGLHPTENK
jgi:hypothetical protein